MVPNGLTTYNAPLMAAIRESLQLTDSQVSAILMINVALTIPARIVVGMLVDSAKHRKYPDKSPIFPITYISV